MFEYLSTLFSEPLAFFDQAIYRTLAVLIGLCCHEWGHAYVAYRCGDDTAKRAGRMQVRCYVGPDAEPEWVDPGDVQDSAPSDL